MYSACLSIVNLPIVSLFETGATEGGCGPWHDTLTLYRIA
eukprot:gene5894-1599_t